MNSESRICSKCGVEIRGKFCPKCGMLYTPKPVESLFSSTDQLKHCPKCENVVKGNFCAKCGASVSETIIRNKTEESETAFKNTEEAGESGKTFQPKETVEARNPFQTNETEESGNPFQCTVRAEPEISSPAKDVQTNKSARALPVFAAIDEKDEVKTDNEQAFADGLPAWNVEPPRVVVRRKKKR